MQKKTSVSIIEELVIFLSIFRWIFLAGVVGILVGSITTLFLKLLKLSISTVGSFPHYYLLLPVAMMLSVLTIKLISPDSEGHGTEKVIEAVHKNYGKIKASVIPIKLITTILTIAFGGSVGKEGPCAQIGGGLASVFSDIFRFNDHDRKKLVICGISAGFAAVFGTPIAGAIFGVEVLFVGNILYSVLLPSLVAGMVGYQVASALGVHYTYNIIAYQADFSLFYFLKIVIAGILFGLCSLIFIEILRFGKFCSDKIRLHYITKALLGGCIILGLTQVVSTEYLGLGIDHLHHILQGHDIVWYAFLLKAVFTSITLNFGGSGGIVTPIFYIGAASGHAIATLLHLDPATLATIGLVSLLAGAANTPIAASIMAVEFAGTAIAPYATVACVVSFLMSGYRSAYHSQVLAINKAPSIHGKTGEEVEHGETHFDYNTRKRLVYGFKLTDRIPLIKRRKLKRRKDDLL